MKSRFDYKLPVAYRLLLLALIGVLVLGTHGYLDESFGTDSVARGLALWAFTVWFIITVFSPHRSAVEVDDRGITVPSIWFPPFRETRIPFTDVMDLEVVHERHGTVFVIWTRTGKRKVHGSFIVSDKLVNWGAPDEFWQMADEVAARYEASGGLHAPMAERRGLAASLPRVDHKAGVLVSLGLFLGLWFVIAELAKEPELSAAQTLVLAGWQALEQADDSATALSRFTEATQADPMHADAYFGLAFVQILTGDHDRGIENYRRSIELFDPPFTHAYGNLGLALLERGEEEEGYAMLLKAVEVDPENIVAIANIAAYHCNRNDFDAARQHLDRIAEITDHIPVQMLGQIDPRCIPDTRH